MPRDAEPLSIPRLRDHRLFLPNPTFANPAWREASPRVLILRLSTFTDVSRSTTHLFLAGEVRRGCPSAFIDMAFLPGPDDARLLGEAGLPLILGTQSRLPLERFDMVLVSNSHLLELVNLPFLLSRSGAPLWADQRDGEWPPLILGGSNATAAHSLVSQDGDCMADAIFFGEGEGKVARMVAELASAGPQRKARLAEMEIDGLWAPASPREVRRARCDLAAAAATSAPSGPVLPGPEATTARLTITLGCACLCSFCYEGHDRRPFREIPAEVLVEQARRLKMETGAVTLELGSFNFNTHSELAEILIRLHRLFLRVNLMSQRVDILARTPGLLELELAADKRSFTLGIEGISGRQRRFLHKSVSDSDVQRALEALTLHKVREIKLFYILTGTETEEDFAEFNVFLKWLKDTRRRADAPPRTVFSFGMLVRMPFTPLRYDPPVLTAATWRRLSGKAKSICETNGFEFRLAHALPQYLATQALALSHSSLSDLLVRLSRIGCISSDALPPGGGAVVEAWLQEHADQLIGEKPPAHRFAFSFLVGETVRDALYRQYQAAKAGKDEGYAAGGVSAGPGGVLASRGGIPAESVRELAGITRAKHKLTPVYREALFTAEAAWLGDEWKNGWLMRRLLALCPGQLENVLSVSESVVAPSGMLGPDAPWFGRSVAAVTAWDPGSFARAAEGAPELFGGPVQGFAPGSWSSLQVSFVVPAVPDPADALAAFLKDSYAPVTIMRGGDSFSLAVPDKSARKKLVTAGKGSRAEGGVRVELAVGTRFRLGDFLVSLGKGSPGGYLVEVSGIG